MFDVVYWLRGNSHDELQELSAASVRKVYGNEITIQILRDCGREPAMLANIRTQLEYLHWSKKNSTVIFLDADVLVTQPFVTEQSAYPWEVFTTWRDKVNGERNDIATLMPYNYGVIGARAIPNVIEAWTWMYQRVCNMADKYQDWYGNQLALSELIGAPPKYDERGHRMVKVNWAYEGRYVPREFLALMLPCDQYNYTPETIDEDISKRYVLHFKGGRKELMKEYAKRLGLV